MDSAVLLRFFVRGWTVNLHRTSKAGSILRLLNSGTLDSIAGPLAMMGTESPEVKNKPSRFSPPAPRSVNKSWLDSATKMF